MDLTTEHRSYVPRGNRPKNNSIYLDVSDVSSTGGERTWEGGGVVRMISGRGYLSSAAHALQCMMLTQ